MEQSKLNQVQEQSDELTKAEWLLLLEVSKLQEKSLYHDQFIKELRQDMVVIIKMVKELKNKLEV